MVVYFSIALIAYLLGSIPSGYLVGKYCGIDLRMLGSGNIGATNTVRVLGKKWGALVFAVDILKGALAVWFGFFLAEISGAKGQEVTNVGSLAAICAVLGHNYPIWLRFEGGKGIAASAGIVLVLFPIWVFVFGLAAWLILFLGTRYVSLASLGSAVTIPAVAFILMKNDMCDSVRFAVAVAMCVLAIWRHQSNIKRLLAGTEKRFKRKP